MYAIRLQECNLTSSSMDVISIYNQCFLRIYGFLPSPTSILLKSIFIHFLTKCTSIIHNFIILKTFYNFSVANIFMSMVFDHTLSILYYINNI